MAKTNDQQGTDQRETDQRETDQRETDQRETRQRKTRQRKTRQRKTRQRAMKKHTKKKIQKKASRRPTKSATSSTFVIKLDASTLAALMEMYAERTPEEAILVAIHHQIRDRSSIAVDGKPVAALRGQKPKR